MRRVESPAAAWVARGESGRADLAVVGGGPVGLVTALYALEAGCSVTVVDPGPVPRDKACGEGLMPAGVAALAGLGIDPDGCALRGITYLDGRHRVSADFPGPPGRGVRRTVLHSALAAAAQERGAGRIRSSVVALAQDDRGVHLTLADGGILRAPYVVAADGLHSPTRRRLRLEAPRPRVPARAGRTRRHGLVRHVRVAPWTDRVEVFWGREAEAYVTPVRPDLVAVAIRTSARAPWDVLLGTLPAVAQRVRGAPAEGRDLGAGPFGVPTRARVGGRVLLAGDASGYVDALTGEGLSTGFQQARAAVAAVLAGDPASYERSWSAIMRTPNRLTTALVRAAQHPGSRRLVVPAAAAMPRVFETLVGLAAGDPPGRRR